MVRVSTAPSYAGGSLKTSTSQSATLLRTLSMTDLLTLGFGAAIGWGWVIFPGLWVAQAGGLGVAAAFLAGGAVVMLVGLTYAELASAMPWAGGEHVYVLRALGRFGSFLCSWVLLQSYVSVLAFEAVAFSTALAELLPVLQRGTLWHIHGAPVSAPAAGLGMAMGLALGWLNARGVKPAALSQTIATALMTACGVVLMLEAMNHGLLHQQDRPPLGFHGLLGLASVAMVAPSMLVGFDVIPQAAEEARVPLRYLGWAIVGSIAMAILWYVGITLAVALVFGNGGATAPLSAAAAMEQATGSHLLRHVIILSGVAGILTSWNAFYIGASRMLYALGESAMTPAFLARIHPRHKTPHVSIWLLTALSLPAPLLGAKALGWIVHAGGLGITLAYATVALSFVVLRIREPQLPRPWKMPWGNVLGTLAFLGAAGLAALYLPGSPVALHGIEWWLVGGWLALGLVCWLFWGRHGTMSERQL